MARLAKPLLERAAQVINAVHAHQNEWDVAMNAMLVLFEGEPEVEDGSFRARCYELFGNDGAHDPALCPFRFCTYRSDLQEPES